MLQLESRQSEVPSPGRYRLDTDRCIVEFSVRHMVFSTVRGRVEPIDGELIVDGDDLRESWVRVDFDAASIATGNDERDSALRAATMLDADSYPVIRFESVAVADRGAGRFGVTGDLYVGDAVADVELAGRIVRVDDDRIGFAATATIDRHGLGLQWPAVVERYGVLIGGRVQIILAAEFVA